METNRKWFCSCRGKPVELSFENPLEEEQGEPTCTRCGASPSSDPKKTISYKDYQGGAQHA